MVAHKGSGKGELDDAGKGVHGLDTLKSNLGGVATQRMSFQATNLDLI